MTDHLCPMSWTGYQPEGSDVFVCGACPHWEECAKLRGCTRATDSFLAWSRAADHHMMALMRRMRAWMADPYSASKREECRQANDRLAEALHQLRLLTTGRR